MRRLRSIAGAIVVAVVLLAVGAGAILVAPSDDDRAAPIPVSGVMGRAVHGGELTATVTSVTLARALDGEPPVTTSGVWVVVDLRVEATRAPSALADATLRLGRDSYSRPDDVLVGIQQVDAGIPTTGGIAFEVSRDALRSGGARAVLQLRTQSAVYPEAVPTIDMDLSRLPIEATAIVSPATVVDR